MNISIYNTLVNNDNYIASIEIKEYKQLKRIITKLKEIKTNLKKNDAINKKIRYYIFKVNDNIILSENDLNNWGVKY